MNYLLKAINDHGQDMIDITLCVNDKCPIKKKCYRWMCQDKNEYQSYAKFEPKDGECEHFIDLDNGD